MRSVRANSGCSGSPGPQHGTPEQHPELRDKVHPRILGRGVFQVQEARWLSRKSSGPLPVETGPCSLKPQDTEGFYEEVKSRDHQVIPGQNFTSEFFHGVSFEIVNGTNETLAGIEELPDVGRLWPVHLINIPKPVASADKSAESLKKRQEETSYPDWPNIHPHLLTNVDQAHEMGFDGRDVVIAIIDSGVEYEHPALGGGFGPGFKFEGGWDLVGPDYLPGDSELHPNADPRDCMGHGTHVAGVIGSSEPQHLGVAHKARLRAYKVFGCYDGTGSDIILAAFLQAYEEGADIISGSLGNDNGFAESPIAMVISKIAEAGVLVVTAAGNSGNFGTC